MCVDPPWLPVVSVGRQERGLGGVGARGLKRKGRRARLCPSSCTLAMAQSEAVGAEMGGWGEEVHEAEGKSGHGGWRAREDGCGLETPTRGQAPAGLGGDSRQTSFEEAARTADMGDKTALAPMVARVGGRGGESAQDGEREGRWRWRGRDGGLARQRARLERKKRMKKGDRRRRRRRGDGGWGPMLGRSLGGKAGVLVRRLG